MSVGVLSTLRMNVEVRRQKRSMDAKMRRPTWSSAAVPGLSFWFLMNASMAAISCLIDL